MAVATTIDNTQGAILVTSYISVIMYGMVLFQGYLYFTRYPRDSHSKKLLVLCVILVDTVQSVFTIIPNYWWLITNYMNPPALGVGYWSFKALFHVDSALAFLSQSFFAYRVWALSHGNKPLCAILFAGVLSRVGLFNAMGAEVWIAQTFAEVSAALWLLILGLVDSMVTDLAITTSLVYYLHRSRTGFNKTDSLINQCIIYAMTTALLPCLFDVIDVLCIATMPDNLIYLGVHLILTKTYPLTLLTTLNIRESQRRGQNDLYSQGGSSLTSANPHLTLGSSHTAHLGVRVTQERDTAADSWEMKHKVTDVEAL